MKKITSLFALFLVLLAWNVNAQITSYPYFEDFESGDGGWTIDGTSSWELGTPANAIINSADTGVNAWVTNLTGDYNTGEAGSVVSPVFDLSSLSAPSIEFSIWWNAENSWDGMVLQSSIDDGTSWQNVGNFGDPNNWFNDDTIGGNPGGQAIGWTGRNSTNNGSGGWVIARHALIGLAGESSVLLRVSFGSDGSVQDEGVGFDSINIFEVSCPEPTGITVGTITDVSAEITWGAGGAETNWEIAVQPAGTGQPAGSGTSTMNNNPYNAAGLTATTAYEIYVRSDCGGEFSSWVGPINFLTFNTPPPPPVGVTCASGSPSFVFSADFDTVDGWTGDLNGGDGTWEIPNDSGSGGTGADVAFSGASFMNYESSGGTTATASAVSPAIDLTSAIDGAELSFYMHAFGLDMGTLNVGVATSAAGPFTNLFSWAGDLQTSGADPWVPIGINLDAYLGQVVYVEFSHTGTGDFEGDMSIDLVRVETCGSFCIAPSSIVVSNIGGTSADIDWNGNNGETSWEYVIVPAGTGEPTGSGTTIGAPTLNAMGLDFSTDYEFWVRADCGGGTFSVWSGPINFSTTVQFDYLVDCNAGPVTTNFCYFDDIDDDPSVATFTYTSSNGLPLNITFNQGQLEGCCDELVVIDSDGTELLNDNFTDVSGITFQSSGDTISWYINSDFSVNCGGSGFTPIDVTVACATCINPAATYQVVDDCANGNQFLIDVNVSSLGDATSLTITNNIDASAVPVTATGVYQIGPFPFLVDVIVTISNDQDANCVINSSAIQLLACPPANDNPCNAIVAAVNTDISCDLITSGTILEATPSGVPQGSCPGDPDDDVWFQFVAENETQVISIINIAGGTFDIDHGVYEGDCGNLTELLCSGDEFSFDEITYVVGNTYYVRVFSGGSNSETTTFDLCIRSAPENIDCENADNPCISAGTDVFIFPSVVGIEQDMDIACLNDTPNPSWFEFEVGESGTIEFQIEQWENFDDMGNPVGDDLDVDFVLWGPFDETVDYCTLGLETECDCPNNTTDPNFYPFGNIVDCSWDGAAVENFTIENAIAGEIYVLLVSNWSRDPGFIQIAQTNSDGGFFTAEIDVDLGQDQELCGFASYDIVASSPFADRFEWYCDGFIIPGETGSTLTVTECCTYTVIAFDDGCGGQAQDTVTVCFGAEPVANPVADIITCDDASADEIEDFDLEIQTADLLGMQDPADFNVTYHLSINDAGQGINPLTSPYTNISNPQTIYVRIEDANASFCFALTSFDLIISGPTPTANSDVYPECDDDLDGIAAFDLTSRDANILGGQSATDFSVSYYATLADAEAGTGALVSPYNSPTATIFVRVESNLAFDCYSTNTMELVVNPSPDTSFMLNDLITCDDASADNIEDFNLESQTATVIGTQNPADFNVTYHLTLAEAEAGTGALVSPYTNVSNPQTIFVRVENATATVCYATANFDLIISGPTPNANSDLYAQCDDDFDGIAAFDLPSRDANILGGQSATDFTVTYYESQADADAGTSAINTGSLYNSSSATIYVRVESNIAFDCFSTATMELLVDPLPDTSFATNFDYEVCPGATTPILISVNANNYNENEVSINWYYEGGLITGENSLTLPVIDAGLYEIEVTFNMTGCSSTVSQMVIELPTCVIPQGISPNDDGKNDTFDLSSYNVTKLEIFNRNGTSVYSKTNYTNEWHGQTDDGDELPVGTYFYTMEYDNGKQRAAWVYIQRLN